MSRHIEKVMGTVVSIDVPAGTPTDLLDKTWTWFHQVESLLSVFIADSEISRIGRLELSVDAADPAVRHVLTRCDELVRLTEGAFQHRDRTPDLPLDPSGYVKGWAVERALLNLRMAGLDRACIGAGGDIAGFTSDGGDPWKVGIRNPQDSDGVAAIVDLADGAVATSGEYERGRHIQAQRDAPARRDGDDVRSEVHQGQPPLTSVSVIGPDLGTCDALATAIWSYGASTGRAAPAWLANFPNHDVLACTADGHVKYSDRLESLIQVG